MSAQTTQSRLLINRDFALLWGGQAASNLGDVLFSTTLMLWIATRLANGLSWAPLAVSGAVLAASLPTVLIGPLAGVLVDRWDKRRVMLWADALRTLLIALLLVNASGLAFPFVLTGRFANSWRLATIYGVVFAATVGAQFFNPARLALIGDIVPPPSRTRASGLTQTTMNIATLLGPPLAAPLFFGVGVRWALGFNALSFALSWLTLLAIHTPGSQASDRHRLGGWQRRGCAVLRELRQGIRFYRASPVLMALAVTAVLVMPAEGAISTLNVFFVRQNLHMPLALYGVLGFAFGAGLIIGSALAIMVARWLGLSRLFWLSLILEGGVVLIYAQLTRFDEAVGVQVLYGVLVGLVNVAFMPLLLSVTPKELLGRVSAVLAPISTTTLMVSAGVTGYLDSTVLRYFHVSLGNATIGSIAAIYSVTGLLIIVGGLYAMIMLHDASRITRQSHQESTGKKAKHAPPHLTR